MIHFKFAVILNLFAFLQLNQSAHKLETDAIARVLNCFVKKLFGILFIAICYFSVDLDYKPPTKSGNTVYHYHVLKNARLIFTAV